MNENKRLILVVRLLLIAWGALGGWSFAEYIFSRYPDYLESLVEVAIKSVNAVLFALVAATLARPVSSLVLGIAKSVRNLVASKPLVSTGSVLLGLVIGIMFGILINAIIEIFVESLAARIIIAFSAASLGAYLGYLGCLRYLSATHEPIEEIIEYGGIVLSKGAFSCEKLVSLMRLITTGKIYVLGKTLRSLIKTAAEDPEAKRALDNYLALTETCSVKIAEYGADEAEERDVIVAFAESKLLKIVVGDKSEAAPSELVETITLSEI